MQIENYKIEALNQSTLRDHSRRFDFLAADIKQQVGSTNLVLQDTPVKRIFADGAFSKNTVYMHMLAAACPDLEIFAACVAQPSAMGAALFMHEQWNNKPMPSDIIELRLYSFTKDMQL